MWRRHPQYGMRRHCDFCKGLITPKHKFANPAPDIHLHNSYSRPCFLRWLLRELNRTLPKPPKK
jgi:hypothetical protein